MSIKISEYIFNCKLLDERLKGYSITGIRDYDKKLKIIENWAYLINTKEIYKKSEKSLQGDFLTLFFSDILGFNKIYGNNEWNIMQETKTQFDATVPDGILGFFTDNYKEVKVIIELKDANTNLDKRQKANQEFRSPVEQAFNYSYKYKGKCRWIIVSNFVEIRLYHALDISRFELFNITDLLQENNFKRFYFLLNIDSLISRIELSIIDKLYEDNSQEIIKVTKPFYNYFKTLRIEMLNTLSLCNQNIDELIILEKCQKLLDRILFIATCEKNYILDDGLFKKVVNNSKQSVDLEEYKVWKGVKNLFESIDKGNIAAKINKFNGGLFSHDKVLEELNVPDEIINKLCKITEYDFNKEISLDVLGNIFEKCIDDIEELKAKIGKDDGRVGQRKRDGIFYTPDYITKYIVKRSIDEWIYGRMEELSIKGAILKQVSSKEIKINNKIKSKKSILSIYRIYRNTLTDMKLLDPACGSGAFLSEGFNYIYDRIEYVNGMIEEINNNQLECIEVNKRLLAHLDKSILRNNIYGVDLNRESVEIAKLSLWLRTANSKDSLVNLDKNIKCGNSLIDDYDVAGNFAFNWSKEFKEIYENEGFDVIVANPPYIFSRNKISANEKEFFYKNYTTTQFQINTFVLFLEQSVKLLAKNGVMGFIIPNTLLRLETMSKIRKYLLDNGQIVEIIQLKGKHFGGANVETVILIFKKSSSQSTKVLTLEVENKQELQFANYKEIDISNWYKDEDSVFYMSQDIIERQIVRKLQSGSKDLSEFYDVKSGLEAYAVGKGNPKQTTEYARVKVYHSNIRESDDYFPYIEGKDVNNFNVKFHNKLWLKYGKHLAGARTKDIFKRPRVLVREIAGSYPSSILAGFTEEFLLNNRSILNVLVNNDDIKKLKYLTLLLNSKLISFYYKINSSKSDRNIFPKVILKDLKTMPIILPEFLDDFIRSYEEIKDLINDCDNSKSKFINYIKERYNLIKVTLNMQNFSKYKYATFIHELEQLNVVLVEKAQYELFQLFKDAKEKIRNSEEDLLKNKKNIDIKIYSLYNLDKSEIDYIENYKK